MIKTKGTRRREIKATPSRAGHVTFTKRRGGLFKKASELCALTGAECAILCESPAGLVFAFGHPSVESVVDKYLGNKTASEFPENNLRMHDELKKYYLEIAEEIEIEKNKSVKVKNKNIDNCDDMDQKGDLYWWEKPFEHLGVEELEEYVSSLEDLMSKLKLRADDLMLIKSSSSMLNACKTLNDSNDAGLSGLVTEDGFLNALLAMKDDELQGFFNDLELRDNNVAVPNVCGDTSKELQLALSNVFPDDDGRAADLGNFDASCVLPHEFSYKFPTN